MVFRILEKRTNTYRVLLDFCLCQLRPIEFSGTDRKAFFHSILDYGRFRLGVVSLYPKSVLAIDEFAALDNSDTGDIAYKIYYVK